MRAARLKLASIALLAASAAPAARAQSAPPTEAPALADRFSMTPAQNGFLRLDKQTGAVSFCSVEAGVSSCRAGADERAALESEIAVLRRENAELKAARELQKSPSGASASSKEKEEEFERALTFAERFFRRMMRILREEGAGEKI